MTRILRDGRVEFRFYRPQVQAVFIAGDVKDWPDGRLYMNAAGQGWWTATARIAPGEYQFHYIADGERYADYAAHGVAFVKQQWTSALYVRPAARRKPQAALRLAA